MLYEVITYVGRDAMLATGYLGHPLPAVLVRLSHLGSYGVNPHNLVRGVDVYFQRRSSMACG